MTSRIFPERPVIMTGFTESIQTPMGKAYVTLNFHEGRPMEVFVNLGKAGSDGYAAAEALARLCSIALQHGVPLEVLTNQLRGISSEAIIGFGPNKVLSMPDGVARVLQQLSQTT